MFKQFTTLIALMTGVFAFSQVGIGTEIPQATLDIVGKPTETTALDGVIAPRITGEQLRAKNYTSSQTGALVYVTAADTAPAGQTEDVTAVGYYYFDGSKWIPSDGYNIYTANGALTNTRTVNLNGYRLSFQGAREAVNWEAGGMYISNLESGTGTASLGFYGGDNSNLFIQQFYGGYTQMLTSGNSNSFLLGTSNTTSSAPINFTTSPGGGVGGSIKMRITGEGNVAINKTTPTERFHTNGNVRLENLPLNGATNAIYTTSGGGVSTTQNQTFTATRTLVADANGVIGYVEGLPSTSSSSGGTINPGEEIRWTGDAPANISSAGGFNSTTAANYASYYNTTNPVPVIEGMRVDAYLLQTSNATTKTMLYRLVNASSADIKVAFSSITNTDHWGNANVIFGPGQFVNITPSIYNHSGKNMTTSSTPESHHSTAGLITEPVVSDIWVNNHWYRITFLTVVDNNNTEATTDDIRKISMVIKRMI